jgi:cell shape-determining protein MreC
MGASVVALLLPFDLFRPAREMTQLIALAQWGMNESTHRVAEKAEALAGGLVHPDEHERVVQQKKALENEVLSLRQEMTRLEQTNASLVAVRQIPGLPERIRLIPARVIAPDADQWREALQVARGTHGRIKEGDWVATHLQVDAGQRDRIREQDYVLARESLLGWVEQTHWRTSRVVLLSDPFANKVMRVKIVTPDGRTRRSERDETMRIFSLKGVGQGKMQVLDIPKNDVDNGLIGVGDLVMTDPDDYRFSVSMVIGTIVELVHNRHKPLYYDAIVRHRCSPESLRDVLILNIDEQE